MDTERWTDYMDLDEIQEAPRNPKLHATEEIAGSISHFGLAELPLLDERTGRLVAGHGRIHDLKARHQAGDKPPAYVRADGDRWLIPVNRGWSSRSDDDAEAYLAASNHLTTKGGWDNDLLAEMLTDLATRDEALLRVTGFSNDDLAKLVAGGDIPDLDPSPPDDFPSYDEDIKTEHTCPSCGYQFSGGK